MLHLTDSGVDHAFGVIACLADGQRRDLLDVAATFTLFAVYLGQRATDEERVALARLMLRSAAKLDSDVIGASLQ